MHVVGTQPPAVKRVLGLRTRREFARRRKFADADILRGHWVGWREAELTSPHERQVLAGSLKSLLRELDGRFLPGASPLNRAAVRLHADELRALAELLDDDGHRIGARGILLLTALLVEPSSPLYDRAHAGALPGALQQVLEALPL